MATYETLRDELRTCRDSATVQPSRLISVYLLSSCQQIRQNHRLPPPEGEGRKQGPRRTIDEISNLLQPGLRKHIWLQRNRCISTNSAARVHATASHAALGRSPYLEKLLIKEWPRAAQFATWRPMACVFPGRFQFLVEPQWRTRRQCRGTPPKLV